MYFITSSTSGKRRACYKAILNRVATIPQFAWLVAGCANGTIRTILPFWFCFWMSNLASCFDGRVGLTTCIVASGSGLRGSDRF